RRTRRRDRIARCTGAAQCSLRRRADRPRHIHGRARVADRSRRAGRVAARAPSQSRRSRARAERRLGGTTPNTTTYRGCKLSWSVAGNGPPVVLIQGVGVAGGAWEPQVDALASNYACLWFDNRGFGSSLPMGGLLTVELMAEDTIAL